MFHGILKVDSHISTRVFETKMEMQTFADQLVGLFGSYKVVKALDDVFVLDYSDGARFTMNLASEDSEILDLTLSPE